ncbi:MAG TPA: molybdenum cofactor guanylyltransferase [Terriglobales bacterium]|nr:molybdenum cofactor guanylyltransferase [Terriglobales bacterium]
MERVTAFVLAGGKSSRMGQDKAFLEFQGPTLLENALELGRGVADELRIVGDPAKFSKFGTVVEDIYSDRGPLGGIHAALNSSEADLNLIIAVDLPLLQTRFLEFLIASAVQSGAIVTVPRVGRHFEPLCAVYRKEFLLSAEQALVAGRNKIDAVFTGLPVHVVDELELAERGFWPGMFRNVNTPEDWKAAQEEFAQRQHVS